MVEAGQLDDARRGAGGDQQLGAAFAVGAAAGERAAHLEAGGIGREDAGEPAREHVGDTVAGALGALAGVVQKGGDEEVVVAVVTALDKPAGGAGGVALVARLLGGEEGEQLASEAFASEGEVGG